MMEHRERAVNSEIAEHRRREAEADASLANVVRATQRFGRMYFGDGDMTTLDMEAMSRAAHRAFLALAIVLIALIVGAIFVLGGYFA